MTHDYTKRYWGHDFTVTAIRDNGMHISLAGWGSGIQKDDYLILKQGQSSTRYQVDKVSYFQDPPDMWSIEASFAPRPKAKHTTPQ